MKYECFFSVIDDLNMHPRGDQRDSVTMFQPNGDIFAYVRWCLLRIELPSLYLEQLCNILETIQLRQRKDYALLGRFYGIDIKLLLAWIIIANGRTESIKRNERGRTIKTDLSFYWFRESFQLSPSSIQYYIWLNYVIGEFWVVSLTDVFQK